MSIPATNPRSFPLCRCGCYPVWVRSRCSIRIIREIAAMEMEALTLAFGRLGLLLHQRALGIDDTPVYPRRAVPAVDVEKTLAEDSNDDALLQGVLFEMCERAGEQLRATRQRATRLELRVHYSDYREEAGKEKLSPPLQSTTALYALAGPLLRKTLTRRTRVRCLYIRLTDLAVGPVQMPLFAEPAPARQAKLESAVDVLRRRYGAAILKRAG
jgi:DNA polymerase-4